MRVYGFHCKTPGCNVFLAGGKMAEDTAHAVQGPINLAADPQKIQCPVCQQTHDYYFSEHVIARATN